MKNEIEWNINLQSLVNKDVIAETHEGFVREAKLSGIRFRQIHIDGHNLSVPEEIELNGEDTIPFSQLRSLTRR